MNIFSTRCEMQVYCENKEVEALLSSLQISKMLRNVMYASFKCTFLGKPAVLKISRRGSVENNEFEILQYLQANSDHPDWYPQPFLSMRVHGNPTLEISKKKSSQVQTFVLEDVYKIIVYEYFEGDMLLRSQVAEDTMFNQLTACLAELHRLNILHADLHYDNIVYREDGLCVFIDYGCAFSQNWEEHSTNFQPVETIPKHLKVHKNVYSHKEEIEYLHRIIKSLARKHLRLVA